MTAELTEEQVILLGWERKEYGPEYQAGAQGGLVNPQSEQEIYHHWVRLCLTSLGTLQQQLYI